MLIFNRRTTTDLILVLFIVNQSWLCDQSESEEGRGAIHRVLLHSLRGGMAQAPVSVNS